MSHSNIVFHNQPGRPKKLSPNSAHQAKLDAKKRWREKNKKRISLYNQMYQEITCPPSRKTTRKHSRKTSRKHSRKTSRKHSRKGSRRMIRKSSRKGSLTGKYSKNNRRKYT